jgi:pimeloyl-ACP methyl ester carboxylesterase
MRKRGWLALAGAVLILAGCALAAMVQTSGGTRIRDVRFVGADGAPMSALLYVPPNATARTPAPGILAVHGYFNSRETQDGFAIEFARRGYVVLALDQTGHGYSASPTFSHGFGGPDGLRYLRSLDFVDKANIGLEGHSMGGWAVVTAAASAPDGYKAMVLEGSSTGKPFAADGTPAFPHNIAVVFSQYDEFSGTMWGAPTAKAVVDSPKLRALFGAPGPVTPGLVYGDIGKGTARVLYTPPVTHAQDHFSSQAIGYSLDWFQRTLTGGVRRPVSDQIWIWKEVGTLIALVGFVVLLLGVFELALALPWFSGLAAAPEPLQDRRNRRWWTVFLTALAIPAATYLPLMLLGAKLVPASPLLPQAFTNQLAFWALLNGLIAYGVGLAVRAEPPAPKAPWLPAIGAAVLTVAVGYVALALADALFKVDFRFWIVGLKLMNRERFLDFLVYLPPFSLFAVLALRGLPRALALKGQSAPMAYLTSVVALAGGFVLFLAAEYIPLFLHDQLLSPGQGLYTIMAGQFVPLMAIIAVIATFTWRRTGSALPGALICGLFVSWYIVAGQAVQAA